LFQPPQNLPQLRYGQSRIDRRRVPRFGELAAVGFDHERHMQITRWRQTECLLQRKLPTCARQQIRTPNYIGDALIGIVNHAGKLIGVQTIAAAHHHIALDLGVEGDVAEATIDNRAARKPRKVRP